MTPHLGITSATFMLNVQFEAPQPNCLKMVGVLCFTRVTATPGYPRSARG